MAGVNAVKSSGDKGKGQNFPRADAELGNLDQIREILFGEQVRRRDAHLLQLESSFDQKIERLQKEMMAQFGDIKKILEQTSADMTESLNIEKEQRSGAHEDLSQQLHEFTKQIQERVDQGEKEIKTQMQDQLTRLQKEVDGQHRDAVASVDRMIADLKSQKADSEDLSSLFAEISSRLSGAPKEIPTLNSASQKK